MARWQSLRDGRDSWAAGSRSGNYQSVANVKLIMLWKVAELSMPFSVPELQAEKVFPPASIFRRASA
jgi:hypothetical protein